MKTPNKIILFDIDHTLFNATLYRKRLYTNIAKEIGSEVKEFSELAETEYRKLRQIASYLTPDNFVKTILIQSRKTPDFKKIKSIFWNKKLYESSIYPDVKKSFLYLTKNGFQIGIFSTGDLKHQKIKVDSLKEYLTENHIYISPDKFTIIKGALSKYKKNLIYLVDDYPQILESAKIHNKNIFTVFIKRNESASARSHVIPDNFTPDATITNLNQLTAIIMSNN